jgi:hypothetical protein
MLDRHKRRISAHDWALGIAAIEVVEKPADLSQRRMGEFPWFAARPARQHPRPARCENKSADHKERYPHYSWRNHTDYTRGDQHPAGLSRQLLDAPYELLVDGTVLPP